MAWTPPRTWTHAEVVTSAMLNEQLRDNHLALKATRDAYGRFLSLGSATIANLDGSALTGIVIPGQNATYSGVNDYNAGTAFLVVPVGTNLYAAAEGGGKAPGSFWIDGQYAHHVGSDGREWRYLGAVLSTPASAKPGSVYVSTNSLRYIDATGVQRNCATSGAYVARRARNGSLWVQSNYLRVVANGQARIVASGGQPTLAMES